MEHRFEQGYGDAEKNQIRIIMMQQVDLSNPNVVIMHPEDWRRYNSFTKNRNLIKRFYERKRKSSIR